MFGIWHFEIKYFGDSSLNTRFICVHMHFIHTSWRKFCAVFLVILSVGLSVCYVTAENVKMFRNFSDKRPLPESEEGQTRWCPFPRLGSGCFGEGTDEIHWRQQEIVWTSESQLVYICLTPRKQLWKIRKAMTGGARDALMGTEPVNIPCYIEDSWRSDPWAPCDRQLAILGGYAARVEHHQRFSRAGISLQWRWNWC